MKKLLVILFAALSALTVNQSLLAKPADSKAKSASIQPFQKINLNKAGAEELARALTGIGLKKAKAIVEYRKTHGKFKSVEDLAAVKGIGVATVTKNHDRILL